MQIVAVDPGAKGGFAFGDDPANPEVAKMPPDLDTEDGLLALLALCRSIKRRFPHAVAVFEKVGGYIGEAQPGSSMFAFGTNVSAARACLVAAGIKLSPEVAPVSWQRHLDLPKRPKTSKGKTQHKNDLKDVARILFPDLRVTLGNADALLLYHLRHAGQI